MKIGKVLSKVLFELSNPSKGRDNNGCQQLMATVSPEYKTIIVLLLHTGIKNLNGPYRDEIQAEVSNDDSSVYVIHGLADKIKLKLTAQFFEKGGDLQNFFDKLRVAVDLLIRKISEEWFFTDNWSDDTVVYKNERIRGNACQCLLEQIAIHLQMKHKLSFSACLPTYDDWIFTGAIYVMGEQASINEYLASIVSELTMPSNLSYLKLLKTISDLISRHDRPSILNNKKLKRNMDNSDLMQLFLSAVIGQATECIKALLAINKQMVKEEQLTEQQFTTLVKKSAECGSLIMARLIFPDDQRKIANCFFNKITDTKKRSLDTLKSSLLIILRYSPIHLVNTLVEALGDENPSKKEIIFASYKEACALFFATAPYLARYSKESDLSELARGYAGNDFWNYKIIASNDVKYGEERENLIRRLYDFLSKAKLTTLSEHSVFQVLPPSSKNTRRAAALLWGVSRWSYHNQHRQKDFRSLRGTELWWTPMLGRYQWGSKLVNAVFKFSQARDLIKYGDQDQFVCEFTYGANENRTSVAVARWDQFRKNGKWNHGLSSLDATWTSIEDLFETALSIKLVKPSQGLGSKEGATYKKKLTQFYLTVARIMWLIGCTQPLCRGSGTFAEMMFAILHRHHNLQIPILKLAFPQLDVLNISFPLSDYEKLFPSLFFEPETLPEPLQVKDSSTSLLPIAEQIEQAYRKFNGDISNWKSKSELAMQREEDLANNAQLSKNERRRRLSCWTTFFCAKEPSILPGSSSAELKSTTSSSDFRPH